MMNKRKIKVGILLGICGVLYMIAICIHYGLHWSPQSNEEMYCDISAGITTGVGFAVALSEYIKGGKPDGKV